MKEPICDLCGTTPVAWEWQTPNKITRKEAEDGAGVYFEDPVWFVCDICHQMVLAENRDGLRMRAILSLPVLAEEALEDPFTADQIRAFQRDELKWMHGCFWDSKTTYQRIE